MLSSASAPDKGIDVVLLSGGVDSATALALACDSGRNVSALFIDYGQPAAFREGKASASVAIHYEVPHRSVTCSGLHFGPGEIRGRNALLVHVALVAARGDTRTVILGIHAGTPYRDCNPDFVRLMQNSLDFHTNGRVSLGVPFIGHSKNDVYGIAHRLGVPLDITYSCESGNEPCGRCLSCLDREMLRART